MQYYLYYRSICCFIKQVELCKKNGKERIVADLETPVNVCQQHDCQTVEVFVPVKTKSAPSTLPNAFQRLSDAATRRVVPKEIEPLTNYDRVYNDLLRYLSLKNVTWSVSSCKEIGEPFVKALRSLLWYITTHHEQFKERSAHLPVFVCNQ